MYLTTQLYLGGLSPLCALTSELKVGMYVKHNTIYWSFVLNLQLH